MKGKFIIITGPSASGKTHIVKELLNKIEDAVRLITTTTRLPREGEEHAKHYFFTTREDFKKGIAKNEFFEYAEVYGNLYGSSKKDLDRFLGNYKFVIGVIDVQGAKTLKSQLENAFVIFIRPGSIEDIQKRLRSERTHASNEEMENRITTALHEISLAQSFDAIVDNHEGRFNETLEKVIEILKKL